MNLKGFVNRYIKKNPYFKTISIIHKNNFGEFILVKNTSTTAKVRKIDLS